MTLIAHWLELPTLVKVPPLFQFLLLEPCKESLVQSNMSGRTQLPLACNEIDNHKEYKIEKILDSWHIQNKFEYLIH